MPLQIKHQSEGIQKTANGLTQKLTYYGTRAEVDDFMAITQVGNIDIVPGYVLDNMDAKPMQGGAIWELDLNFSQSIDNQGNPIIPDSGPTDSALSTRMISIPLESLTATEWVAQGYAYRTNWNYALAGLGDVATPEWWSTATNLIIQPSDRSKYCWLSNENDVSNMPPVGGQYWGILKEKTEPGVEAFYFPVYEITESAKHKSKDKAAWVTKNKAGNIVPPMLGDFGIKYGNWLCMGGSVAYDGKNWVAVTTYQHSPVGWSTKLYITG